MAGERNRRTMVVRERGGGVPPRSYSVLEANTILGSYRLISILGEGAVGRVYLAEHVKLGRKVAIKVLRTELSANQRLVARFFAEARAANDIAHENIVAITDFFENDKNPYFIMEYL